MDEHPLIHQRLGCEIRTRIAWGAGALAIAAVLVMVQAPSATGLVTFILLTLWCHGPLSPFLPAAYEPVLMAYGQLVVPLQLAVVGALASTGVEYLNYYLYRRLLQLKPASRFLSGSLTQRLASLFLRWPFFTVWICVLSPLPDWGARILAAHSGYSVSRYLTAVLLARLPRFWFLAAIGLQLELGAGTVVVVIAASFTVALITSLRRRGMSALRATAAPSLASTTRVSEPAMRTIPVLLLGLVTSILPVTILSAQQAAGRLIDGPAKGVTVDRFLYEGTGITAVSFRFSALRSSAVGTEIGVSLFPEVLRAHALLLAPDFGAAYNVSVPRATLLLKAGGSAITGLGHGIAFLPGIHLGGGLIVQVDDGSGLRLDVIRHIYQIEQETESIWSVGLGVTGLPRRRNLPATR